MNTPHSRCTEKLPQIVDWLESRMKITVPHFHVFAYISIFSSSAQDDGCTRHNDNQKCNNKHKKRLLPPILSHQQHPPGQGKFFLWVKSQNYLQYYSQCSDSSLGLIILFILKYCRSLWVNIKPFNLNHPCYFNLHISIDLKCVATTTTQLVSSELPTQSTVFLTILCKICTCIALFKAWSVFQL